MIEEVSEHRGSVGAPLRAHDQPLVLQIHALGVPEVRLEDVPLHFPTKKTLALLLYLAVTGTPQPREQLAAHFWPDREDERARATLRSTLRLLRQTLADAYDNALSPWSEVVGEPSEPRRSSERCVAPQQTDLFVRSGHDRLGRDCLWVERSASKSSEGSLRAGALSTRTSRGYEGVAVHLELDLDVLEHAATRAARLSTEQGDAGDALALQLQHLTSAMAMCEGPFLAGFSLDESETFTAWVEQQRAYWQGRMDQVFATLSHVQLEHGAFAAARETAARWTELNALSEAGYQRLMEAHAAGGDRTAALAAYARCRETLGRTLGVEPAPETLALAERIRRQPSESERSAADGSGEPVRPQGTHTASSETRPVLRHRPVTVPHMDPSGDPTWQALPLVGREAEFAALVTAGERARQGTATVVVLEGAAGMGKTRLAGEFLRWASQARGAEVLRGQAFEASGCLPYLPLVEALRRRLERERAPDDLLDDVWLAELSRLLPELRERYPDLPQPLEEASGAQARLFEAVAQLGLALAQRLRGSGVVSQVGGREGTSGRLHDGAPGAPLVLFLDDVHWMDVSTRDLVRFVVRRWREAGAPALVLLSVGREELRTHSELRDWLRELARDVGESSMSTVALAALGADTVRRLLEELAVDDGEDVADASTYGATGVVTRTGDGSSVSDRAHSALSQLEARPRALSRSTSQTSTIVRLAQWLYAETGGQPLYLVQMLRTLMEQNVLAWVERDAALPAHRHSGIETGARWQLRVNVSPRQIAQLRGVLPASMRAVIQKRLERLSTPTRQLLLAGAVLGTRFRPEQAWAIADLDEASGLDALEEAEKQLVIRVEPERGGGSGKSSDRREDGLESETCHFTHDKLCEVIYIETGAVRRRVLHRRAYELLAREDEGERNRTKPAELAHHALLAGLPEPAYRHSMAAGDAALDVYAVRDAIGHYERARQLLTEQWTREGGHLPAESREQARLFTQLGRAYEWIGAWEEARNAYQALRQHARECGNRTLEGTSVLRLAMIARVSFEMATSQALAREALALAAATGGVTLQSEAEQAVAQSETIAGEPDEALPHARLAIAHSLSGQWNEAVVAASEAQARYAALEETALEETALEETA